MESLILSLIEAGFIFVSSVIVLDFFIASKKYKWTRNDHFDGHRFFNIGWTKKDSLKLERREDGKWNAFTAFLDWIIHRKKKDWEKRNITPIKPEPYIHSGIKITFVGHATVLIQINGLNILTDPVWSERTSPISWLGPKRYVNPGINLSDLPPLDIILVSHNHYDHMDISTLRELRKTQKAPIYTWLGNKSYLEKRWIDTVIEMDWWDIETRNSGLETHPESTSVTWTISDNNSRITFVPAQHFSARGITDRNKTLWWWFVVEHGEKSIYFAGDTWYGQYIEKIQEKYPHGINVWLLPMWAYKPRWFMAPIHTNPEEALKMQKDLKIQTGIGIHYGTFPLADDNQDDPIEDLEKAKTLPEYHSLDFRIGPNGTVWDMYK